jgi:SlyX protein
MNDDALEQLETKMAFLERANAELSDVVFRQQRNIDLLRAQIAALASRMQTLGESDVTPRTPEDERPPHY